MLFTSVRDEKESVYMEDFQNTAWTISLHNHGMNRVKMYIHIYRRVEDKLDYNFVKLTHPHNLYSAYKLTSLPGFYCLSCFLRLYLKI